MTGEELRLILKDADINLADLAGKLNKSPQSLNQALNAADIKSGLIEQISDAINVPVSSLYARDGKAAIAQNPPTTVEVETRPRIPMAVAAGSLTGFTDSAFLEDCQQIPVIKALPAYDYTIIVKGDSMEPKFEGGDEIAIRKVYDYIEWGKPYVLDTRDGAVLKRLYDAGDDYKCVSYNSEYPEFKVQKKDVLAVYKVVGLIRI